MPFTKVEQGSSILEEKDLTYIYNSFFKKAVASYEINGKPYFDEITRFKDSIGSIINGIVENLNSSDLVIADLTGNNPNVMYELGVRHSLKRGTIMLTQNFNSLPSDLRDYLAIEYKYPSSPSDYEDCYKEFEIKLHNAIEQIVKSEKHDSPVLELLNYKVKFREQDEIDNLKEQIIILKSFYADMVDFNQLLIEYYNHQILTNKRPEKNAIETISWFLNSLASKLDLLDFKINNSNLLVDIEMTKVFIADLDRSMQMDNYPHYLMNIPEEENIFQKFTLKELLEKEFIDPIVLRKERNIRKVKFLDAFSDIEFIRKDIFEESIKVISDSSIQLGVYDEIEKLIEEFDPRK
ncbi:MAG: hypothetical protein JJT77_04990 [Crocinitomicaceae bacterium]|nr:hypothetical protein [Crocinitomicaceae bacterium]